MIENAVKTKKGRILIAGAGLLGIACSSPAEISYNPGDRMPSLEGYERIAVGKWISPLYSKFGRAEYLKKGDETVIAHYVECGDAASQPPFLIMHLSRELALLDNSPTDGTIDTVLAFAEIDPDRTIGHDAPDCLIKI